MGRERMSREVSRPRVLLVLERYPWPLQRGDNYRRLNIVRRLQGRFVFDLYCCNEKNRPPPEIKPYFDRIIARLLPTDDGIGKIKTLLAGLTPYDPESSYGQARSELDRYVRAGGYDVVVASLGVLPYLPQGISAPMFGDIIDNDCLAIWRDLRNCRSLAKFFSLGRALAAAALNQRAFFRRLSAACYVSEVDAAVSRRITPSLVHEVIPSGVDPTIFRGLNGPREPHALVFEGNMGFPPNVDAACYFVSDIFPRIRAVIADARFYIVGKDPDPDVLALACDEIIVTGFVEDIRPWLNKAQVFVSPLRTGAGIKTKVLQAWAAGVSVVATSKSTGGLKIVDGENIIIRDGAESFAQAVVDLLQDPLRARTIGQEARRTVEQHHTWDQAARRFGDALEQIINSRPV